MKTFAGNQNVHSTAETCIGCGANLNLSKSPDTDVLKKIILKTTRETKREQRLY
jgi:hypothetical protein